SDIQAIVPYTKSVIYLDDYEVAHIRKSDVRILDRTGMVMQKPVTTVDWTSEKAEKEGYPHFMLKEIFEQPRAVAHAVAPHVDTGRLAVQMQLPGTDEDTLKTAERIFIIACGT